MGYRSGCLTSLHPERPFRRDMLELFMTSLRPNKRISLKALKIGGLLSSQVLSARPPVRPSAVLLVVTEATGHVTDEGPAVQHAQQSIWAP